MGAAVLGNRLPEVTQMPFLGPGSFSFQCRHCNSSKVLAGLAFCEMLSQYPQSAFQRLSGVAGGGQQQFATQTFRVHLLGIEKKHKIHKRASEGWQGKVLQRGLVHIGTQQNSG